MRRAKRGADGVVSSAKSRDAGLTTPALRATPPLRGGECASPLAVPFERGLAFLMPIKIVDTILPTTMVGSFPRPHWYKHQLLGRDIRIAFKEVQHEEAYQDAVATVIRDQEEAGLDIVTDGNMWYDDYVGVIGSFCWYMYERIGGFEHAREPHPSVTSETE